MKNQFLEKIKNNLLNKDSNRLEIDKYYKEIKIIDNNLYIKLKENKIELLYNEFILKSDEYKIIIYDIESDIERFSINYLQFEDDELEYNISDLIDRYFQLYIIYLENE